MIGDDDLRDCFAMLGLCMREEVGVLGNVPEMAYQVADAMLEARRAPKEPEVGIVAVKSRRRK